jgi:hypothetical protein
MGVLVIDGDVQVVVRVRASDIMTGACRLLALS